MFTQEINKQNTLIYVVLSTTINDIDIEEINIFTEEEWNKLNIMNKVFRKHQIDLEDMSDDSYSRFLIKLLHNMKKIKSLKSMYILWIEN